MRVLFAMSFLTALCLPLGAGEVVPSSPTVRALGLRLVAPATPHPVLRPPFDATPGTTVALLLHAPAGGMVKIDKLNSALTTFADDKGNDLTHRPAGSPADQAGVVGLNIHAEITPDGKYCALEARAPALPATDATHIKLEGQITVIAGSKQAETEVKNVALRDGSKFTVGALELTIDETGKPEEGLEPFGLTVRAFGAMDNIATVRFFKADGTEIMARRNNVTSTAALGAHTEKWYYRFAERADVATLRVGVWTDLQKIKVPFKIQTGLGVKQE